MKMVLKSGLLLVSLALAPVLSADDSGGGYSGGSEERSESANIQKIMDNARGMIGNEQYKNAIRELYGVIRQDGRHADAWNLIGYSHRKQGNYKKAGKAYRKALKYNPAHKGALEYQGELFITLEQFDKARANRDKLAELCPDGCEQLSDLELSLAAVN